ncbi:hypothetical protein BH20VER1_BH20VER1_27170 [soil metagenome]
MLDTAAELSPANHANEREWGKTLDDTEVVPPRAANI